MVSAKAGATKIAVGVAIDVQSHGPDQSQGIIGSDSKFCLNCLVQTDHVDQTRSNVVSEIFYYLQVIQLIVGVLHCRTNVTEVLVTHSCRR